MGHEFKRLLLGLKWPPGRGRVSKTVRMAAWMIASCCVLALAALLAWQAQVREDAAALNARGRLHFEGATALVGRMAGHELPLPPLATRCANCHALGEPGASAARAQPAGAAPLSTAGAVAPALGRESLTTLRQRRGGPASRYDSSSLCRLLALGQDPVHVVISTAMPRYEASPEQCQELWAYLSTQ